MIYDSVAVRISVSNKGHVWWGGGGGWEETGHPAPTPWIGCPGITRGAGSCQRSQNVETLLTIQYHLSLRFHFRCRYLLLDLLLLRWTEKAWLESLPAVLDSTWKIRWQQKCQVMHESVEYDRPGEFLDTPAISTQLSTSFNYYKCF